jgi:MoaA/NifB/PqqE/SkfB family radical SAM enzyme
LERLSIELTDRCDRACTFCYARARPDGARAWAPADVIALVRDCAAHGTRAVSFGGGEPLQYPALLELLSATRGLLFRSLTTNGLLLDALLPELARAGLEKVHVSVHDPDDRAEVDRAARQAAALEECGIRGGVNLLVRRSRLGAAREAARLLRARGIGNDRIVFLPMRYEDTPSPTELAGVAGGPFQSAACLSRCGPSPRFASIASDGSVAWCSYTRRRAPLRAFTRDALAEALDGLGVEPCGGTA